MSIATAYATLFLKRFNGRTRRARVLVTEGDMIVHVVTDRVHANLAQRSCSKEVPGDVGEMIRLAAAAAQQVEQGLCRQILDLNLLSTWFYGISMTAVADHGFSFEG
jgi:hypothetical protein